MWADPTGLSIDDDPDPTPSIAGDFPAPASTPASKLRNILVSDDPNSQVQSDSRKKLDSWEQLNSQEQLKSRQVITLEDLHQ